MLNEIENPILLLQNRVLPQVANAVYRAAHEADYIYVGKAVTALQHNGNPLLDIIPHGSYVVPNNAHLAVTASHVIDLLPGFEAVAGSVFDAQIVAPAPCIPDINAKKVDSKGDAPETLAESTQQEPQILVYPNPTTGNCIVVASAAIALVRVYDMLGNKVNCNVLLTDNATAQIHLQSVEGGAYLVQILTMDARIFSTPILLQP